jgi:hypothetical protein
LTIGLNSLTNAYAYNSFKFPCSGILRNISFIVITNRDQNQQWQLLFGDVDHQKMNDDTPFSEDVVYVQAAENIISVTGIDFDNEGSEITTQYYQYFIHSKKSLKIRNDRIYNLANVQDAGIRSTVIMQAEFLPYPNAHYKMQYSFDGIASTTNWDSNAIVIPTRLRDVVIEYEAYLDNASEVAGLVQPTILSRGKKVSVTGQLTGIGTFDDLNITGDMRAPGTIDSFLVASPGSGLGYQSGAVRVRDIIAAGEKLGFDIENKKGSVSGLKLDITIHGKTYKERMAFKTLFLDSNAMLTPMEARTL